MTRWSSQGYSLAVTRSEELLTIAIHLRSQGDEQAALKYMDDATALADEWSFPPSLRRYLINAALENVHMGRGQHFIEQEQART